MTQCTLFDGPAQPAARQAGGWTRREWIRDALDAEDWPFWSWWYVGRHRSRHRRPWSLTTRTASYPTRPRR